MQSEPVILAFLGPIGMPEMIVIALLGLLIFGRKLPEVGRGLGRSIVEFKRGLTDVKDEVQDAAKDLPTVEEVSKLPGSEEKPASAPEKADPSTSST